MRPLRCLLLYLAVIFLGAALLAPWLYWLAQWAGGQSARFSSLSTQPFYRYVNRSLLGLALAGLWPFLHSIGVDSWRGVGLVKPTGQWHRLLNGFALGFLSLAFVALLAILCGARTVQANLSTPALLSKTASAGLTAAVVAFLEELVFRGALFGALRKVYGCLTALVASSAFYAFAHFFEKAASPSEITWSSGLELLPRMFHGFAEIEILVPAFFALFIAGMILGLAYERTQTLYLSIGLHAGWIFWLKFYGAVTVQAPKSNQGFWGTGKLIDGWLTLGILIPMLLGAWFFFSKKKSPSNAL